jgi:tetratricopeptide (TPR) repeat protein/predicted Ser/Thr protein kinase
MHFRDLPAEFFRRERAHPRTQGFPMDLDSLDSDSTLADLISLWQRRRAEGKTLILAELCHDRPELLPALERRIAALQQLETIPPDVHEQPTIPPQNNEVADAAATVDPYATPTQDSPTQTLPPLAFPTDSPADQLEVADVATTELPPALLAGAEVVPGYEVLGVLGKGGMGIVYKARQHRLGRLVALKMILHAEHAGNRDRQRFQAEAEAVARLQHPNIVQIHEVGEHRGLPYFSLEFCAGGSLEAKLAGKPLAPQEAARLVETLAQAMQAAHDKGILHRDLKPANVLLTENGTPKITDFGLAKKLGEQGPTQTGSVMGTPSYMAPEQAGGNSKDMGPTADIYALGAILYELLTGRPPFMAATALDTVMLVISEEPVPPRRLQPKTPRDLETICLKCLQKEPMRRYASAAALAEDLRRFQNHLPIAARPVGPIERGWRWCRRNPMVASLTALVVVMLLASSLVSWGLAAWALGERDRADEALVQVQGEQQKTQAALTAETKARKRTREALTTLTDDVLEELLGKQAVLGKKEKAFLRKVKGLYEGFAAEQGETEEARAVAAEGHFRMANLHELLSETSEALRESSVAVRLYEKLSGDFPDVADYRRNLAKSCHIFGVRMVNQGKLAEGETACRQGVALQEKLTADFPAVARYRRDLANGLRILGFALQTLGNNADAEAVYRRSIALLEKLSADFPHEISYRSAQAASLSNLGFLLSSTKPAEAETAYGEAIAIAEKLIDEFPDYFNARYALAQYYHKRGLFLRVQGKRAEAEAVLQKGIDLQKRLLSNFPSIPELRIELAKTYVNTAALFPDRPKSACGWYGKAIPLLEVVLLKDSHNVQARHALREAHLGRAMAEGSLGDHGEAAKDWQRAEELDDEGNWQYYRLQRSFALLRAGQQQAAIRATEEVLNKPAQGIYTSQSGAMFYDAACIFALSATGVKDNAKLREQYAVRAVALLRQAQTAGFFDALKKVEHLKKDTDLESLRQRGDFKKLVVELESKTTS